MKSFLLQTVFLFSFLSTLPIDAQITIQKYYNTTQFDEMGRWASLTPDGDYVITGVQGNKAFIAKVNSNGDLITTNLYNHSTRTLDVRRIAHAPFGTMIVGVLRGGGFDRAFIIFTDDSGNILWQKQGPASTTSFAEGCTLLSNGDFLVYGWEDNRRNGFLSRITSDGEVINSFRFDHGGNSVTLIRTVFEANNGDFVMTGYADNVDDTDLLFIRMSPTGDIVTSHIFSTNYHDALDCCYELPNGDIIVSGVSFGYGSPSQEDPLLARLDPIGNQIWAKRLLEIGLNRRFYSCTPLGTNIAAVATAHTVLAGTPNTSIFVFDENGVLLADKRLDLNLGDDFSPCITTSKTNNIVAIGTRSSLDNQTTDAISFIKYDNYNTISCEEGTTNVQNIDVLFNKSNYALNILPGLGLVNSTSVSREDMTLMQTIPCRSGTINTVEPQFGKVTVSPNPTQNLLYLKAEFEGNYRLFDQGGRLVRENKTNSQYHEINCSTLPDGIYFLEYISKSGVQTKKIVVQK